MVALNRVQKRLTSMMDVVIAEATLLKFVLRLHLALETWETQAKEHLLRAPAIHVDETSLRVDQKNHWIPVYSAGDTALKFYIESAAKRRSSRLTSFRVTVVPSSMTVGHPILLMQTATMVCAGRICCAN